MSSREIGSVHYQVGLQGVNQVMKEIESLRNKIRQTGRYITGENGDDYRSTVPARNKLAAIDKARYVTQSKMAIAMRAENIADLQLLERRSIVSSKVAAEARRAIAFIEAEKKATFGLYQAYEKQRNTHSVARHGSRGLSSAQTMFNAASRSGLLPRDSNFSNHLLAGIAEKTRQVAIEGRITAEMQAQDKLLANAYDLHQRDVGAVGARERLERAVTSHKQVQIALEARAAATESRHAADARPGIDRRLAEQEARMGRRGRSSDENAFFDADAARATAADVMARQQRSEAASRNRDLAAAFETGDEQQMVEAVSRSRVSERVAKERAEREEQRRQEKAEKNSTAFSALSFDKRMEATAKNDPIANFDKLRFEARKAALDAAKVAEHAVEDELKSHKSNVSAISQHSSGAFRNPATGRFMSKADTVAMYQHSSSEIPRLEAVPGQARESFESRDAVMAQHTKNALDGHKLDRQREFNSLIKQEADELAKAEILYSSGPTRLYAKEKHQAAILKYLEAEYEINQRLDRQEQARASALKISRLDRQLNPAGRADAEAKDRESVEINVRENRLAELSARRQSSQMAAARVNLLRNEVASAGPGYRDQAVVDLAEAESALRKQLSDEASRNGRGPWLGRINMNTLEEHRNISSDSAAGVLTAREIQSQVALGGIDTRIQSQYERVNARHAVVNEVSARNPNSQEQVNAINSLAEAQNHLIELANIRVEIERGLLDTQQLINAEVSDGNSLLRQQETVRQSFAESTRRQFEQSGMSPLAAHDAMLGVRREIEDRETYGPRYAEVRRQTISQEQIRDTAHAEMDQLQSQGNASSVDYERASGRHTVASRNILDLEIERAAIVTLSEANNRLAAAQLAVDHARGGSRNQVRAAAAELREATRVANAASAARSQAARQVNSNNSALSEGADMSRRWNYQMQEVSYGVQDFLQVISGGGGVGGALRAANNNISQFFAAAGGPQAALYSGAATVAVLGIAAAVDVMSTSTKRAEHNWESLIERTKAFNEAQRDIISATRASLTPYGDISGGTLSASSVRIADLKMQNTDYSDLSNKEFRRFLESKRQGGVTDRIADRAITSFDDFGFNDPKTNWDTSTMTYDESLQRGSTFQRKLSQLFDQQIVQGKKTAIDDTDLKKQIPKQFEGGMQSTRNFINSRADLSEAEKRMMIRSHEMEVVNIGRRNKGLDEYGITTKGMNKNQAAEFENFRNRNTSGMTRSQRVGYEIEATKFLLEKTSVFNDEQRKQASESINHLTNVMDKIASAEADFERTLRQLSRNMKEVSDEQGLNFGRGELSAQSGVELLSSKSLAIVKLKKEREQLNEINRNAKSSEAEKRNAQDRISDINKELTTRISDMDVTRLRIGNPSHREAIDYEQIIGRRDDSFARARANDDGTELPILRKAEQFDLEEHFKQLSFSGRMANESIDEYQMRSRVSGLETARRAGQYTRITSDDRERLARDNPKLLAKMDADETVAREEMIRLIEIATQRRNHEDRGSRFNTSMMLSDDVFSMSGGRKEQRYKSARKLESDVSEIEKNRISGDFDDAKAKEQKDLAVQLHQSRLKGIDAQQTSMTGIGGLWSKIQNSLTPDLGLKYQERQARSLESIDNRLQDMGVSGQRLK